MKKLFAILIVALLVSSSVSANEGTKERFMELLGQALSQQLTIESGQDNFFGRSCALDELSEQNKALQELLVATFKATLDDLEEFDQVKEDFEASLAENSDLRDEVATLKQQIVQCGQESVCKIEMFGHKFVGVASSDERAELKALAKCTDKFSSFQCNSARPVCLD